MMFVELHEWPFISTTYIVSCLIVTMLCYFDYLKNYDIFFDTFLIFNRGEYWRLFTSFFYLGELTISYIFSFVLFIMYFTRLESSAFRGKAASYLYCLFILGLIQIGLGSLKWKVLYLSTSLQSAVIYVWCKKSPNVIFRFLVIFLIRAAFIPWAYLFMQLLMKGDVAAELFGIIGGHIYYYFQDVLPQLPHFKNVRIFRTPYPFVMLLSALGLDCNNEIEPPANTAPQQQNQEERKEPEGERPANENQQEVNQP